ncbi:hypothetical protein F4778DRAFT_790850 [Xylariomycetidae sp. FL2044]|nr:hypothetical protein F4778DRAFT_790850 [Xylariomycetidae sp. FL2044]
MSRLIDTLPTPTKVYDKKVIVLSRSRIGTFSLYSALKILGYKPYHMYEVVTCGPTHMALFEEALRCKYLRAGKPYGKAEFDKWLAGYDAVVEIPQFFTEEFIEFYPDAQFILTERDQDAWVRSMQATAGPMFRTMRSFPLTFVRLIDSYVDALCKLHWALDDVTFYQRRIEGGMELAKEDTLEIHQEDDEFSDKKYFRRSRKAKALVPKEKLLVAKLEDGFGWEQICPFLGHEIPATRYPRGNAPAEFKAMGEQILAPRMLRALAILASAVVVPSLSVGAWYYLK